MTTQELVTELNNSRYANNEDRKIEMLKKHLKTEYLDYDLKIASCKQILESTRYKEINGKKVYVPNGVIEYYIKIIAIIQLYFDFEIRDNEERQIDFNLLEKNNITELLIKAIPREEIERFNTVYNIIASDMAYNASLVPFMDTKFEAISIFLGKVIESFDMEKIQKMAELGLINNDKDK